jgi:hypothetical protein
MNKQRETIYGLRRQLMMSARTPRVSVGENGVARDSARGFDLPVFKSAGFAGLWDVDTYAAEIESNYAVDPAAERR